MEEETVEVRFMIDRAQVEEAATGSASGDGRSTRSSKRRQYQEVAQECDGEGNGCGETHVDDRKKLTEREHQESSADT